VSPAATTLIPKASPSVVAGEERARVASCLMETHGTTRAAQPILLQAKGLTKSFGGQVVLAGIDLELRQGEVVLLRGENGSGKTTLLNILTGNLEPDAGTIDYLADGSPRSYSFPRRWWQELNPFDHFTPEFVAREGIGRTWQDVRLFGAQSLRDNIAVAESGHPGENPLVAMIAPGRANRREADLNRQADDMLSRLGLAGREASSADMISLGQSKRVAIARAVAAGAKILFLDEPLAGLDSQGIVDVLALLKSLTEDHYITLVIVEHVFNFVHLNNLVGTHWELSGGKVACDIVTFVPKIPKIDGVRENVLPRWLASIVGTDSKASEHHLPHGALLTRIRRADQWKSHAKPVLDIKDLVVNRGSRTVIGQNDHRMTTGFSLAVYEGEIAVLQAPNGWGKSTLFAAICGLTPLQAGSIALNGDDMAGLPPWIRVRMGMRALPSDHNAFDGLRVDESLRLGGRSEPHSEIDHLASRSTGSLSGGERRKVVIQAMSHGVLAIYDEPFSALDQDEFEIAVKKLLKTACAILILEPNQRIAHSANPIQA